MLCVALAALISDTVKADCDVDAPNLYLYYEGTDMDTQYFSASKKAYIDASLCIECGRCVSEIGRASCRETVYI